MDCQLRHAVTTERIAKCDRHRRRADHRPICGGAGHAVLQTTVASRCTFSRHRRHHDQADSFDHARPRVVNAAKQSERCFMAAVRIRASSLVPSNTAVITSRTRSSSSRSSRSSRDAGTRHRSDVISSLARRTTSGTPLVRRLRRSRDSSLSDSPAPRPSITVLVADFVIHDDNCDENVGRAPHTSRKRRRPPRRAAFNRADDEIRTRDPHLGKAMPLVQDVRELVFRTLPLFVEPKISVSSVGIAERSTVTRRARARRGKASLAG